MAHYRSTHVGRDRRDTRHASMPTFRPFVAFLIVASFGVLFVGCAKNETEPEEVVFTQNELQEARELAGRGDAAPQASGSVLAARTMTGSVSADAPVVDLSMIPTYDSIRTGPSTLPGDLYRVTFDFVNVRSEPRVTASNIGRKQRGEFFNVTDFVNSGWAKVRLEDGVEGYVSTQYLAKVVTEDKLPEEKKKFEGLYSVDFQFLNVRKEPNSNSEKLGELPGQSIVRPLVFENEWAKIVFEGKEGYVSKEYLVEFMPPILVRQERFQLPMLHYDLTQSDALDTLVSNAARLQQEGITLITLRDFYDLLLKQEERDVRLDSKNAVLLVSGITVDTVKSLADTLQRNKIRATVFLKTSDFGISGITEKAVLSLVAGGHDVQSAGHTGDDLRSVSDSQVELELKQSRKLIEDITRKPVFAFLYPLGGTNDRVMQLAAQAGYLLGITNVGDRTFTRDMLLRLPSFSVNPTSTNEDVLRLIRG